MIGAGTYDPGTGAEDEPLAAGGYRTYEVFQRERVGESAPDLTPRQLIGDEMLTDPYPTLAKMREHSPCYRDWIGNRFWVTRYDDVTSVFADDANYRSRSARWWAGVPQYGRDLGSELPVLWARSNRIDAHLERIVERMIAELRDRPDLATAFAARLPLELWGAMLDLAGDDLAAFSGRLWRMRRSTGWNERSRVDGHRARAELEVSMGVLLEARRHDPGDDLISALATLELVGEPVTAADVVATIFESDDDTLHGGVANLWFQLLTNREQLAVVERAPRLAKQAWHEALRHSPPVHTAARFARHEVERFGRLIPDGALVACSAAAANRDPRVFADPDRFLVERPDLCQREPRGQYRADGLASGIAFGLGRPSVHPALPKERPRSSYAIVRDIAVTATRMLLDAHPGIRLADGASPKLRSLRLGEMYTCWELPVDLG